MDTARRVVALLVLVGAPPGFVLWLVIHPFASFWRKLGAVWTYVLLSPLVIALMAVLFWNHGWLLGSDFGTSYLLCSLAALCLAAGLTIASQRRKYLTSAILAGLPELSERRYPGEMLTQGIYSKIRHPRYVEAFFWLLGYSLFANYLGSYVAVALLVPVLWIVVILEERELRQRFGERYTVYCQKVPRFLPRWS
jgi:protein-S-isoprenylcysteine O-methyltransferase Ste14